MALTHSLILSRAVTRDAGGLDPVGANPQEQGWLPMPHETAWQHGWQHGYKQFLLFSC